MEKQRRGGLADETGLLEAEITGRADGRGPDDHAINIWICKSREPSESLRVKRVSASLGDGSPLGWLWLLAPPDTAPCRRGPLH